MGWVASSIAWISIILFLSLLVMGIFTLALNWYLPSPSSLPRINIETESLGAASGGTIAMSPSSATDIATPESITLAQKEFQLKRNMFIGIVIVLGIIVTATTLYAQPDMEAH